MIYEHQPNAQTCRRFQRSIRISHPLRHPCPVFVCSTSRERHKFRIPRHPVCADIVLRKALFGVDSSSLVKADPPRPHQPLDVALAFHVKASARVAFHDIGGEVKVGRCEARFDVAHKGGREAGVDIILEG